MNIVFAARAQGRWGTKEKARLSSIGRGVEKNRLTARCWDEDNKGSGEDKWVV